MSTLHITNGDCAADTLRSFITDPVAITADVLHAGPAPAVDDAAWYEARAGYLGSAFGAGHARDGLARSDAAIASAAQFDEVVLWFEHDLFDQLLLVRTLDRIPAAARQRTTLICVDRFPGIERFIGLGQLTAAQLASLVHTRQPVTAGQFALAARTWGAFRSEDPRELLHIARAADVDELPFLGAALLRFFDEYPSVRNGLSRTADRALHALTGATLDAGALFGRTQADEARPFMGDLSFFDVLRSMAGARTPLVELRGNGSPSDLRGCLIAITDAGRDVAAGRADAIALNGIDEWRGGVHLAGDAASPWRWDAARTELVSWM